MTNYKHFVFDGQSQTIGSLIPAMEQFLGAVKAAIQAGVSVTTEVGLRPDWMYGDSYGPVRRDGRILVYRDGMLDQQATDALAHTWARWNELSYEIAALDMPIQGWRAGDDRNACKRFDLR